VEERLAAELLAPWCGRIGLFFFSPLHQFDSIKLTAAQGEENKLNSLLLFNLISLFLFSINYSFHS